MGYITKIEDYWIAPSAVNISLNAMGDPNRIQGSVASGAVISCYIDGIPGLELDNGRNPKRWPLSLTPTYFNSFTEKYIYVAIPRSTEVGTMAVVVFPSELIYLDGTNEAGIQVGSEDYYYVWLQGIISATDGYMPRTKTAACDFGSLGTYEDIVSVKDVDWYSYDKLTQIVTFLKGIVMKPGSSFYNLILGGKELKGVATADTSAYYIDSDTLVATPGYLHANYLNKKAEDTAEEQIGFLKGLWIGTKGLYEITADGMGKFKSLFAESVNAQRVQADEMQSSNFTGDGISDTGWQLTNNHNGHSKLIVDELYVRMKAVFESLEVKKEMVTGGNQIFSRAANVICRTDYFDANGDRIGYSEVKVPWLLRGLSMVLSKRILNGIYSRSKSVRVNISDASQIATIRCYFLAEEGGRKVNNLWSVDGGHDLARCQTFNLNRSERTSYVDGENVKLGNVFWWRKVVGVSSNSNPVEIDGKKYHYFDVSNQSGGYLVGSDLPCAGDEVSQWGNDGNEDRMHLVTIEVDGGVAIKAYEGIYTFDMSKCWYGGNPCKMNLSPQNEYRFTGRSFKIETEYGIRPVPVDIDVDWASQTKSRAEYAETGISVGQLIIKNYYYDRLPHNGSLWLCLFSGSAYWARYAKYDAGVISYVTEDVFNTLPDSQKLYVRVSGRTGLADNQVCRRMEYTSAEPGTNSAVWHQEVAKGQNGIDAQDVEWVYIRTKTNEAPVILSDSTYTDHNGHTYTADDHLPRVTGNANIENNEGVYECTDDPKGVDDTWKYEWEIKRSKGAASDGHRAWNYYQGAMTLHNNLAESAFIIDTDNDNDQFGTDSNSEVLVQQVRSTSVRLYDGATPQQLKPINVDPTVSGVSAVLKYIDDDASVPSTVAEASCSIDSNDNTKGIVAITFKTGTFAKSGLYAEITAIDTTGRSKQTVFTVRKVLSGQPGLNPIIYQLAPTQKSFSFSRTAGNALTPSSRSSQVNVAKTEGNTTNILSSAQTGISYQWGFDTNSTTEETGKAVGSSVSISNTQAVSHYQVWIELSTGDRETLPIVKDGLNGAMGDTPMQAFQWDQSATTAPSPLPSGANLGDWSLTAPNRPSPTGDYYLWQTQTVKHTAADGTVTYDAWSAAVRISGNTGPVGPQGPDGDNGEDGVTLLISPASLIVNQDLNNPNNLSNLTQTFVVAVYKGSVAQTVNGIGFTAETVPSSYPTAYKGLFLNSSSQRVGSGNVNGNILTLKQINTYTQGQQTLYYDNFYADLVVNYGNLKTISGRVRIYANLLGTWKQTIEGDVSTEMAQRIAYLYDPNNPNQVVKNSTYGEFVRSSTENMSKLSKAIMSRNIMPMTGWTDITGDPYPETGSEHFDPYTQELEAEEPFSRAVALEANKNYCFSIYTDSNTVPSLYLLDEDGSAGSEVYFGEMTNILSGDTIKVGNITYYRHYIVFDISDKGLPSGNYLIGPYVDASVNLFYRPQLETGSTPTDYGIPTLRYDSEIYQNAEQIDMSVSKNEMEQAGIHINGSNSTIDLVAGRVNFKMPGGGTNTKISIGSDGKLNAVDGNFEGTVRATNFYQQMSVFYEGNSSQPSQYSYCKYYCTDAYDTFQQGHYYDPSVVPAQWYYNFIPCTYDAEVVNLIPNPTEQWNSGKNTCYLPDPKDFVGKVVHVYAPKIGSITSCPIMDCVVRLIDQNDRRFAKWIYLDGNRIKAQVLDPSDTVALGTEAIYQAIYADGDNKYYWLKLL
jgi:hypothetical protein